MTYSEPELRTLYQTLRSSNLKVATDAFTGLEPELRRVLRPCASLIVPEHALDDVVQEAMIKLWERRLKFEFQTIPKWKRYLKTTAINCSVDWHRKNPTEGEIIEVPTDFFEDDQTWNEVECMADERWLGYDPRVLIPERNRRVLAAQLHYQNGLPWEKICHLVNGRTADHLDRQRLDEWLGDPAVLRHVCYRALYLSGPALVRHLLELDETPELHMLLSDSLAKDPDGDGPGGWKNGEVAAIVWGYGFQIAVERIVAQEGNSLSETKLIEVFERSDAKMPFQKNMASLINSFGTLSKDVFTRQRVFKRLVFQYGYHDEMPQKDILVRLEGAAKLAGYRLTAGTLNMWLSGRRLVQELCAGVEDE